MSRRLAPGVLALVQEEATEADAKHGDKSLLNPEMPDVEKLAALVEEVGEVGRALTYDGDQGRDHLVVELIQVASVALSWATAELLRK